MDAGDIVETGYHPVVVMEEDDGIERALPRCTINRIGEECDSTLELYFVLDFPKHRDSFSKLFLCLLSLRLG